MRGQVAGIPVVQVVREAGGEIRSALELIWAEKK